MTTRGKPRGICWHKARQTHCERGHEFTPENTYTWTDSGGGTHRQCRACNRAREQRRTRRTGRQSHTEINAQEINTEIAA
jgi:hypothetical protein